MIKIPKVSLSAENRVQQSTDYPKLSLEHGEKALIVCIEPEPTVEYKHVLRAPEIGPDGKVLKEVRKTQKGEEYEAVVQEFIGQHLCFGDFGTLQDKGIDPDNCPTCRAAQDEEGIPAPTPHYAMHVFKYSLQPGTYNVREPFAGELQAWVFSPTRLNTIIDAAEEWGDLRQHDLKLGPCENKKFQKYDINVAKNAQWLAGASDEEINTRKQIVAQTYTNNQCPDLSTLIARRISKGDALSDVQKVVERIAQVNNRSSSVASDVPDLSALKQQPKANESAAASGLDAFKSDEANAPGKAANANDISVDTTTGEVTEKPALKQMDFADIMADL